MDAPAATHPSPRPAARPRDPDMARINAGAFDVSPARRPRRRPRGTGASRPAPPVTAWRPSAASSKSGPALVFTGARPARPVHPGPRRRTARWHRTTARSGTWAVPRRPLEPGSPSAPETPPHGTVRSHRPASTATDGGVRHRRLASTGHRRPAVRAVERGAARHEGATAASPSTARPATSRATLARWRRLRRRQPGRRRGPGAPSPATAMRPATACDPRRRAGDRGALDLRRTVPSSTRVRLRLAADAGRGRATT